MKITMTPEERDMIVEALQDVHLPILAARINDQSYDPADDGPEISILNRKDDAEQIKTRKIQS